MTDPDVAKHFDRDRARVAARGEPVSPDTIRAIRASVASLRARLAADGPDERLVTRAMPIGEWREHLERVDPARAEKHRRSREAYARALGRLSEVTS